MYYLVEGGEGRAERRMGMNLSLHYSPAHRWSYFPVPAHDATLGPPRLKSKKGAVHQTYRCVFRGGFVPNNGSIGENGAEHSDACR